MKYKEEIEFLKEKGYILKDKTFEDLHYLPQCTWEDILKVMEQYKEKTMDYYEERYQHSA